MSSSFGYGSSGSKLLVGTVIHLTWRVYSWTYNGCRHSFPGGKAAGAWSWPLIPI